jgi:hypothetical protein
MRTNRLLLAAAVVALTSAALVPPAVAGSARTGSAASDPPWTTVATGLDNPRLLSFGRDGLYVAEAGRGGSGPCVEGAEGQACFGMSGAITRITRHGSHRVVTGLPSLAGAGGGGAAGPHDVVVPAQWPGSRRRWDDDRTFAATIGLGNDPAVRSTFGEAGRMLGTVVIGRLGGGHPRVWGDIAAYEQAANPDKGLPDTNPTGLLRDGRSVVLTDSGGNDVLRVRPDGRIKTLAVFPDTTVTGPQGPMPMQAVPTSVVRGPDDAYYVSQLTGFPFPPGGSSIWRFARGQEPTVYATGLTNVTDLAWYRGALYAVQLSSVGLANEPEGALPTGSLVRVTPGAAPTTVMAGLPAPYGVALRHDTAYLTTCAVCAGGGAVVAVDLP